MIAMRSCVSKLVPGAGLAALVVMLAFLGALIASNATGGRPTLARKQAPAPSPAAPTTPVPAATAVRAPDTAVPSVRLPDTSAASVRASDAAAERPVAAPARAQLASSLTSEPGLPSTRSSAGLVLFGALAIGAFAWWRRRRTTPTRPEASFELVAQTGLGGRARALWMRAGQRDLLVAVTPQSIQLLDRWTRPDAPAAPARRSPSAHHVVAPDAGDASNSDRDDDFDHVPTGDFEPAKPAAPGLTSLVQRISTSAEQRFHAPRAAGHSTGHGNHAPTRTTQPRALSHSPDFQDEPTGEQDLEEACAEAEARRRFNALSSNSDSDSDSDSDSEIGSRDRDRIRDRIRDRSSESGSDSDSDSDSDFRAELRSALRSLRSHRHTRTTRSRLACPRGAQEPR